MSLVSLVRCRSYRAEELEPALELLLAPVCRLEELVRPGMTVLLKPNLLGAHPRRQRVTTDPALVRAVGRLVKAAGGRLLIGDSPALDSTARVARKTGMAQVAQELGGEIVEFAPPVAVPPHPDALFRHLELAEPVVRADLIINLPKLKTHCQMLLTLGVKNLFGCVVAQRKAEWHHMVGRDRERFAALLLDIHRAAAPALTILDGVWGMEGRGPSNGRPRELGILAASRDALALDLAICDLLGVPRRSLPLYRAAAARGMLPQAIELAGDDPSALAPSPPWELPRLEAVELLPGFLDRLGGRFLTSRPAARRDACRQCGKCLEICPASALELTPAGPRFDYERCIRCYCCQEVCPFDAIDFKRGFLLRIMQALGR